MGKPAFHKATSVKTWARALQSCESIQADAWNQYSSMEDMKRKDNVFDAMLPGMPKIVKQNSKKAPNWRTLNLFVCSNGTCTLDGEAMAPEYMDLTTGKKMHIIRYEDMEIEVTPDQWHLMWDHVVCPFMGAGNPHAAEFTALHKAREDLAALGPDWQAWKFPGGQQVHILQKQLEHRLRAIHKMCPNPTGQCCPWSSGKDDPGGKKYKQFLTKEEAAELVIDDREKKGEKLKCIYDPVVYSIMKKRGHSVPPDFLRWSTAQELDREIAEHGSGMSMVEYLLKISQMDPNDSRLHQCPAEEVCGCCSDDE